MPVDEQMLKNALEMCIQDYTENPDNILQTEISDIKKRFNQLLDQLEKEATEFDDSKDQDD